MSSYTQHSMLLTPLTLGVLEDSGWYIANYSQADWLRPLGDFGFQQGCSFATSKCLAGVDATVGIGNPPHFYGGSHSINAGTAKCTTDRRAVGYTAIYSHQSALPAQYQYFSNPTVGGDSPNVFDYCPAVQAYTNVYCSRSGDASINSMYYGETYGLTSACMDSSLVWTTVS
jgi:leishmanolysin-like peptidase